MLAMRVSRPIEAHEKPLPSYHCDDSLDLLGDALSRSDSYAAQASEAPLVARMGALLPIAALGLSPAAHAKPNAPEVFCGTYPEAPACAGGPVSCMLCHDNTSPASWNAYGDDLRADGCLARAVQ